VAGCERAVNRGCRDRWELHDEAVRVVNMNRSETVELILFKHGKIDV
jgi:hypothetical protein